MNTIVKVLSGLNPTELWLVLAATALLLLFIVYRLFGKKMLWVLIILYIIIFLLYINNVFNFITKQEEITEEHEHAIQAELNQ